LSGLRGQQPTSRVLPPRAPQDLPCKGGADAIAARHDASLCSRQKPSEICTTQADFTQFGIIALDRQIAFEALRLYGLWSRANRWHD
jgi:hypothetical protein